MKTHLVTFATDDMRRSQDVCVRSAIIKGGIGSNEIHAYNEWDIRQLREEHAELFTGRGFGYWCWKAWLINRLTGSEGFMRNVEQGDLIVYADAGVEFLSSVNYIVDRMDQDIFLFGNNWEHAHWCKADVVKEVMDSEDIRSRLAQHGLWATDFFGKQVQASVIFFRVSDYSRKFVQEWLDWCLFEGGRLIDDSPSRVPNHPEFREHRHDQAILTTLAYREGVPLHYWPAVYNRGGDPEFVYEKLPEYAGDTYPTLFDHHRRRNHEWSEAA